MPIQPLRARALVVTRPLDPVRTLRPLSVVVLASVLAGAAVLTASSGAPIARGAMGGSSASGNPQVGSGGFPTSVSFSATRGSGGNVTGSFSMSTGMNGPVTCLITSGTGATVGGVRFDPLGGPNQYVVFFVTDGGPNPSDDTLHINATTFGSPPTCTEIPDGTPQALTNGNVLVDDGTAGWTGPATVDGSGTAAQGSLTRTFDIHATRDASDVVSGTFSWNDSGPFGGGGGSGTIQCLRVIGNRAILGGQLFGGGPSGPNYIQWELIGGTPATGARVGVIQTTTQPECTEAPPFTDPLATGSITLTGGGAGGGGLVTVAADAFIERMPFQGETFKVAAKRTASGVVSGRGSYLPMSGPVVVGDVTCLEVAGPDIVVGLRQPADFSGNPPQYATIWAHDGDLDATPDTWATTGSTTSGPPDCSAPSPLQDPITRGQITLREGASDTGTVDGDGQSQLSGGSGTRTFDFTATLDAAGIASGTVSIQESHSFGSFSFAGNVRCVDIRGDEALIVAEKPVPPGGFPSSPRFAIFFVTDGGPAGAGDLISFDTYTDFEPFECIVARVGSDEPVTSGDISIGSTPPPPPPPTTGSLVLAANREDNGQLLPGVRYGITGPGGYNVDVGDGDPADVEPNAVIIRLDGLTPGDYSVCIATAPPEWWELFPGCDTVSVTTTQPASLNTTFRFVPNLAIPNLAIPDSGPTPKFGVYEKSFALTRQYTGVYHDKRYIDVTVTFQPPSGPAITVPAFWTQDYVVRPGTGLGAGSLEEYDVAPGATTPGIWRVRFSPDQVGTYTYTIHADDHVSIGAMSYTSPQLSFQATAAVGRGQVERDPRDSRSLRFRDGTPYVPLGHDAAFEDGNPATNGLRYYTTILDSFAAAGEDWTRIWMTDFNRSALEWSVPHWSGFYEGPGRYSLRSAWRMDEILELAASRGIQVQLVLNDHGQFSTWVNQRWNDNPYRSFNGGPVANPQDFFTNPEAKRLFKQRLDYLVARYGAYRNVLAWELFNEVQFVGTTAVNPGNSAALRSQIAAWHTEMAAYLRAIDPYDHLITTSSTSQVLDPVWADPNIDLVQVHDYGDPLTTDARIHDEIGDLQASTGKPVHLAEFGLGGNVTQCHYDPTTSALPADEDEHLVAGTHLHNAVWTAALSMSNAGSWWWGCYVQADAARNRTAPDFPLNERVVPALRAFLDGEDLAGMGLGRSSIGGSASVVAVGLDDGSRGFVWVRDALNEFRSGARPGDLAGRSISGASISLAGFAGADGTTYTAQVWSPYGAGGTSSSVVGTVSGGSLVIPLPAFTRDIALKIVPGGSSPSADLDAGETLTATSPQLETSITTPNAGVVTIAQTAAPIPPTGYGLVGLALTITAPAASAGDPLVLQFRIDASQVPVGDDETTIQIFRNGTAVPACTGPAGDAVPDPCVSSRVKLGDGDIVIRVLTSAASEWLAAVPRPTLGAISGVTAPVAMGTAATLRATLSDAGSLGGHTATWTWGDGTTSAGSIGAASGGSATVTGTRTYTTPGVYEVELAVSDPSGQSAGASFRYVVVYDPSAGFATGSGTIVPGGPTSTPSDLLPGLDGTSPAEFGFVIKYKKGASEVPGGSLTFRYAVGAFELSSGTFSWLVVTNDNWARFQGTATIEGQPGLYPFRVDARDSNKTGTPDSFQIRIWAPGADPATAEPIYKATGDVTGQVTIHRK